METAHLTFEMLSMTFAFLFFAFTGNSIYTKLRDRGYELDKRLK